jgi:pentose-5-phosphate-3-epimerase
MSATPGGSKKSMRPVEIIPAILPKKFDELEDGLAKLKGVTSFVQIDLVGTNVLAGKELIPFWEEFDYEIDIMLANPEREVRGLIDIGASRIVVHANASTAHEALEMLQETRTGEFSIEVGVALAAHDTPDVLKSFEGLYDYVQVMGIDHIGKQGEPPDPHHHELVLIKSLRAQFPTLTIQVDGAVAPHVRELAQAGANRLIVGSAIMSAENPLSMHQKLFAEANRA